MAIVACPNPVEVADAMNCGQRNVAANSTNLYYRRYGPIEFRFPSVECDGAHICAWAEFCAMFVAAAVFGNITIFSEDRGGASDFRGFDASCKLR